MPRAFRKKRPIKRRKKRYVGRPNPRQKLMPSLYFFKRSATEVIELSNASIPTGWSMDGNAYYRQFFYSLNQLTDYADFTSLFKFYKICGVKQELILSNTQANNNNTRLIIYMDKWNGRTEVATENMYLHSQTAKRRIIPSNSTSPVGFYTGLRVANATLSATPTAYTWTRPKWCATNIVDLLHYGMNIRIGRVDNQPFGSDATHFGFMKVITTMYICCKKVG